jgi:hypothetical protein
MNGTLRKNFYENSTVTFRTLQNPPARLPLPRDMAETIGFSDAEILLERLEKNLRRRNLRLADLDRINIAYPHKHPDNEANDKARGEADILRGELKRACKFLDFPLAKAIYETVHLGRSENQSSLHALTGKQIYEVAPELQTERLPFIERGHNAPEYFILVDWAMGQGTTLANLASYLTHNGAEIIGAVIPAEGGQPLAQRASCDRYELARVFQGAAADQCVSYSDGLCLTMLNTALEKHGRSLDTLTHNEFKRLQNSVDFNPVHFFNILDGMGMDAAARRALQYRGFKP